MGCQGAAPLLPSPSWRVAGVSLSFSSSAASIWCIFSYADPEAFPWRRPLGSYWVYLDNPGSLPPLRAFATEANTVSACGNLDLHVFGGRCAAYRARGMRPKAMLFP